MQADVVWTDETLDAERFRAMFDEHGYVILKGFLEAGVVADARTEMSRLVDQHARKLRDEGRVPDLMTDEPFETRLYKLYENNLDVAPTLFRPELHLAGTFGVFFHPRLLDVVELVLGSEVRLYPNYTVRPKLPDWEGTLVLWHQDGAYTDLHHRAGAGDVDVLAMVNVWSPLVPARTDNGCMQFVPGTHKLGVVPHEERQHYLEIAADELSPRVGQAVDVELDPGDVVLFHNLLFHQGLPNHAKTIRWSMDWRYQDATQSTLRPENGHLARSNSHPTDIVKTAEQWANLTFS